MALFLKILCDIAKQAKFIEAGPTAAWLWLAGVGHCRLSSTDGFIHKDVVPGLVPRLKSPYTHASRLVEVGLWEDAVGGYHVHDYLDMNPSKAELAELKRIEADRKRTYRAEVSQRDTSSQDNETSTRARRAPASSPSPSDSVVVEISEESPRETTPAVWGHGRVGAGRRSDTLVTPHTKCDPATFGACNRGLCVPAFLSQQWRQQIGNVERAHEHIRAFVGSVLAGLPDGPIGDEPLKFWRESWQAKHGTQAPSGGGKGNDSRDAMARALSRLNRDGAA